jgi:hypothetical protein
MFPGPFFDLGEVMLLMIQEKGNQGIIFLVLIQVSLFNGDRIGDDIVFSQLVLNIYEFSFYFIDIDIESSGFNRVAFGLAFFRIPKRFIDGALDAEFGSSATDGNSGIKKENII